MALICPCTSLISIVILTGKLSLLPQAAKLALLKATLEMNVWA